MGIPVLIIFIGACFMMGVASVSDSEALQGSFRQMMAIIVFVLLVVLVVSSIMNRIWWLVALTIFIWFAVPNVGQMITRFFQKRK